MENDQQNEQQKPKLTIVSNSPDIPLTNAVEPLENQLSTDPENVVPIDQNDPDPDPAKLALAKRRHPSGR